MDVVYQVYDLIGGRFVLIECNDHPKLISFYERNNFVRLQKDGEDGLVQMVRFLQLNT